MTIQNNIGLTGFSRNIPERAEGYPSDFDSIKARPYRNAILGQISTVTIASFGADADSFTIYITLPNGTRVTACTITRAASVPVDDTAAAVAAVTAINALAALNGHVTATSALGVITLTFDHANIVYLVETAVTACTATVATTQAAGGSALPVARFVAAGTSVDGQPAIRQLTSTDRDVNVRGILVPPRVAWPNAQSPLASATDQCPAGQMGAVAYEGHVNMKNVGDAASAPGGVVFAVVAATGGDEVGQARSDVDGVAGLWTITPTAAELDFMILVEYTTSDGVRHSIPLLSANPDGSASATEIADAWRTAAATAQADGELTGFTFGGTATLTIAGPTGLPFSVVDVGEGVSATVETTPAAVYSTPLDLSRFYWAEAVAAGAVGPVMCRC